MGLKDLLFSKKNEDVKCEGTFYVYCPYEKALEVAKKGNSEYKMLGASIHVLECEEKEGYFYAKVQINKKEDYRSITVKHEPENSRCSVTVSMELNHTTKAKIAYDTYVNSFQKECSK